MNETLRHLVVDPIGVAELTELMREAAETQSRRAAVAVEQVAELFVETHGRWPRWVVSESWVEGFAACAEVWATDEERPKSERAGMLLHTVIAYNFGSFNETVGDA